MVLFFSAPDSCYGLSQGVHYYVICLQHYSLLVWMRKANQYQKVHYLYIIIIP